MVGGGGCGLWGCSDRRCRIRYFQLEELEAALTVSWSAACTPSSPMPALPGCDAEALPCGVQTAAGS